MRICHDADYGVKMAVRKMLAADDPALHRKAKNVTQFGKALDGLIADMWDTMYAAPGIGLAAVQIGVPLRICVIEMPEDEDNPHSGQRVVLCNPEIVRQTGSEEEEEGCLSVPDLVGDIVRAASVTVKAQDPKGKKIRLKATGLMARALQHEIDHLNGVLFVDHAQSGDTLRRVVRPESEIEEGDL